MQNDFNKIKGSYKLSAPVIKRLTQKRITDKTGKSCAGASKLMIGAMIYFSHICSESGHIYDFRIADLSLALDCDIRSTFNVLSMLEERGFIHVSANTWNGYRNITLIDNDFSSHVSRYINTNYDFLDYKSEYYAKFKDLSLYSMRMLLLLLLNYNSNNGYRVSCDTLCSQLGLKKRSLIKRYQHEISGVLGNSTLVMSRNPIKRIKYGNISIAKDNRFLKPNTGLRNSQDSYYNHYWKTRLRSLCVITPIESGTLHRQAGRLCAIVSEFLKKNLSLNLIENVIEGILSDHGVLSEHLYTDIYTRLYSLT